MSWIGKAPRWILAGSAFSLASGAAYDRLRGNRQGITIYFTPPNNWVASMPEEVSSNDND